MKTNRTIGCAGILVEDIFCGPLAALPAAGQLAAISALPSKPGGCAANVALDLAKQGLPADLAGVVGSDASATVLLDAFQRRQIGCSQLQRSPTLPTSRTVILLIKGEDRRYLHVFGANAEFSAAHLPRAWLQTLGTLYLGGLFVLPGLNCRELAGVLHECRTLGVRTVVDVVVPEGCPAHTLKDLDLVLAATDYFLPNDDEARRLTGLDTVEAQMSALLKLGAKNVIITRGGAGAVAGSGNQRWTCGSYAMDALDPSGAGDAFASGILTGIAHGWTMPVMLEFASALGASATRAIGTTDGVFTFEEARQFVKAHPLPIQTSTHHS